MSEEQPKVTDEEVLGPVEDWEPRQKWSEGKYRVDCLRCDHSSDWHRLDDATNFGPTDPGAQFRCLGFDPSQPGSPERRCDCPDMVRP